MALKTFNPITPSQRQLVIVDRSALYKGKPVKALTEGLTKSGGRNNLGRITARFIGGGHKRTYRLIDFKRRKFDVEGTVERIEYDPNRTAFIALVNYADGERLISSLLSASLPVTRLSLPRRLSTSSPATPCRCSSSRSAPSSTTWK